MHLRKKWAVKVFNLSVTDGLTDTYKAYKHVQHAVVSESRQMAEKNEMYLPHFWENLCNKGEKMYGENNPEQKEKMRSCNFPEKFILSCRKRLLEMLTLQWGGIEGQIQREFLLLT